MLIGLAQIAWKRKLMVWDNAALPRPFRPRHHPPMDPGRHAEMLTDFVFQRPLRFAAIGVIRIILIKSFDRRQIFVIIGFCGDERVLECSRALVARLVLRLWQGRQVKWFAVGQKLAQQLIRQLIHDAQLRLSAITMREIQKTVAEREIEQARAKVFKLLTRR